MFYKLRDKIKICLLLIITNITIINASVAKELWSSNSVSLLYGTTFEVPLTTTSQDKERYVITLQHVSDNDWGDLFTFLDIELSSSSQSNSLYGEFIPRISISRFFTSQEDTKNKFLKETLLALNLEYGVAPSGINFINTLIGIGTDINVPYFQYLKLNFFRRFNQRTPNNWQFTPVFASFFTINNIDFNIDGWADFVSSTSKTAYNIHSQIQFTFDIGKVLNIKDKTFYLGTEYKYWKNKFGIQNGPTEQVWQLLAQVKF